MSPRETLRPPDLSEEDTPSDTIERNDPDENLESDDPEGPILDLPNPEAGPATEVSDTDNRSPY